MNVEHADALTWLCDQPAGEASVVVYDPPYAVGSPVRGREDGAAGSVFGPLSFMSKTLADSARLLRPGGIVMIFADWRRMADLGYIASTVGLRPAACVAWVRTRPGTGGLFRASWDPILLVSRGTPTAVDRAAVRNVVEANYPSKRRHPYEKPVDVYLHVFQRACSPGDSTRLTQRRRTPWTLTGCRPMPLTGRQWPSTVFMRCSPCFCIEGALRDVDADIEVSDGVTIGSICEHRETPAEAVDACLSQLRRVDYNDLDHWLVTKHLGQRREWRWNGAAFEEATRPERSEQVSA